MPKARKKILNHSKNNSFIIKLSLFLLVIFSFLFFVRDGFKYFTKINGLIMLIEFEEIDGILQWEKELEERNLTALIKVQDNVLEKYPQVFKRLAEKGHEIAGGYSEGVCWDMPYEEQLRRMKTSKEFVEKITGKKMRVYSCRYFSYDENTLKAADELGIDYVLARGTKDIEATIYQPEEYKVKIISVSNVDVGEPMGRGSLCDYSLWARGTGPESFDEMISESINKKPANMILVSHAYLGGTRLSWWKIYEKYLSNQKINWHKFENWIGLIKPITLPNTEIPLNKEVKYTKPMPEKEIDEYESIPGLENLEIEFEKENSYCQ